MIRFLLCFLPLPSLAGTIAPDYDDSPVDLCVEPDAVAIWQMSYDKAEFPEIYEARSELYEASCPGQQAPPMPPLVDGELPPCIEARLDDLACLDTLKHQPGPVNPKRKLPEDPAPVPLPPTAAFLLGALGLAGVVVRRRR